MIRKSSLHPTLTTIAYSHEENDLLLIQTSSRLSPVHPIVTLTYLDDTHGITSLCFLLINDLPFEFIGYL